MIRLPLAMLNELISRPCGAEPWFPCRVGEYVLLPDGRLGLILRQTLDQVQLKVVGSVVHYPTADFFQLNARNLSRQGFSLAVQFGIDYRHQAICLDKVPQRFQQALITAFENAGLAEQVEDIAVEFKEAGANSLDYLLYLTMKGEAASAYFKIGRLVQQTCVAVCNEENWVIPFGQLTIHQGDGFETLRASPALIAGAHPH
ncbi:MAG: mechanosensitive ion channel [Candidatus Competibacteraceae bacterium]|nr:mechanosensitive ion channel [Candidatus Competibacteraceae bacterium]